MPQRETAQRWTLLLALCAVGLGVLSLYRSTEAAPPVAQLPFANSVEQRFEIINQLKETNALLREQNALLRSGKLRVQVEVAQ